MAKSAADRITTLKAAFSASSDLQRMFPSMDGYIRHMLKAEFDSDDSLQAEFPNSAAFVASAMHDGRRAGLLVD